MNLFSLEGKIAFVTGAGSGIGQRIAVGLAEAGASVDASISQKVAGLNDTLKRIETRAVRLSTAMDKGRQSHFSHFDL